MYLINFGYNKILICRVSRWDLCYIRLQNYARTSFLRLYLILRLYFLTTLYIDSTHEYEVKLLPLFQSSDHGFGKILNRNISTFKSIWNGQKPFKYLKYSKTATIYKLNMNPTYNTSFVLTELAFPE